MRIAMVSEAFDPSPLATGARRAADGLTKALPSESNEVVWVAPLRSKPETVGLSLARRLKGVEVSVGGDKVVFSVFEGTTPANVAVTLLAHDGLPAAFDDQDSNESQRLRAAWAKAVAQRVTEAGPNLADVLQATDATGLLALAACRGIEAAESLTTALALFDDATVQGVLTGDPAAALLDGGFPTGIEGLKSLDVVTAASVPALRAALVTAGVEESALGDLDGWVQEVLEGIDTSFWNPATSPHLTTRYDAYNLQGKRQAQGNMRMGLELELSSEPTPLVLIPGTLLGPDESARWAAALEACLDTTSIQVALEGDMDSPELDALKAKAPERVRTLTAQSPEALHAFLASADIVLTSGPQARFANMVAMRFGVVPVTLDAPNLDGRFVDMDEQGQTGVALRAGDEAGLAAAIKRAAIVTSQPHADRSRTRLMLRDVGWDRAAAHLAALYQRARL